MYYAEINVPERLDALLDDWDLLDDRVIKTHHVQRDR
jgi:hypothetical protein